MRLPLVRQRRQRGLQTAGARVGGEQLELELELQERLSLMPPLLCFTSDIGSALRSSHFGSGSGLFHYERLGCRGDEKRLGDCRSRTFVTGDCSHGNEAAVVCAPPEGECNL